MEHKRSITHLSTKLRDYKFTNMIEESRLKIESLKLLSTEKKNDNIVLIDKYRNKSVTIDENSSRLIEKTLNFKFQRLESMINNITNEEKGLLIELLNDKKIMDTLLILRVISRREIDYSYDTPREQGFILKTKKLLSKISKFHHFLSKLKLVKLDNTLKFLLKQTQERKTGMKQKIVSENLFTIKIQKPFPFKPNKEFTFGTFNDVNPKRCQNQKVDLSYCYDFKKKIKNIYNKILKNYIKDNKNINISLLCEKIYNSDFILLRSFNNILTILYLTNSLRLYLIAILSMNKELISSAYFILNNEVTSTLSMVNIISTDAPDSVKYYCLKVLEDLFKGAQNVFVQPRFDVKRIVDKVLEDIMKNKSEIKNAIKNNQLIDDYYYSDENLFNIISHMKSVKESVLKSERSVERVDIISKFESFIKLELWDPLSHIYEKIVINSSEMTRNIKLRSIYNYMLDNDQVNDKSIADMIVLVGDIVNPDSIKVDAFWNELKAKAKLFNSRASRRQSAYNELEKLEENSEESFLLVSKFLRFIEKHKESLKIIHSELNDICEKKKLEFEDIISLYKKLEDILASLIGFGWSDKYINVKEEQYNLLYNTMKECFGIIFDNINKASFELSRRFSDYENDIEEKIKLVDPNNKKEFLENLRLYKDQRLNIVGSKLELVDKRIDYFTKIMNEECPNTPGFADLTEMQSRMKILTDKSYSEYRIDTDIDKKLIRGLNLMNEKIEDTAPELKIFINNLPLLSVAELLSTRSRSEKVKVISRVVFNLRELKFRLSESEIENLNLKELESTNQKEIIKDNESAKSKKPRYVKKKNLNKMRIKVVREQSNENERKDTSAKMFKKITENVINLNIDPNSLIFKNSNQYNFDDIKDRLRSKIKFNDLPNLKGFKIKKSKINDYNRVKKRLIRVTLSYKQSYEYYKYMLDKSEENRKGLNKYLTKFRSIKSDIVNIKQNIIN